MNKRTFMVHVLSKNDIELTQKRIMSLLNVKEPTNVTEVRSIVGLANFSARYIPNQATMAEPLRRLTLKKSIFVWGKEHIQHFETIKSVFEKNR